MFMSFGLMSAFGHAEESSGYDADHRDDRDWDGRDHDGDCGDGKCQKPPKPYKHTPFTTLENNTHKKTEFGWNETPFVYLQLKRIDKKEDLNINYVWTHGTDSYTQSETYSDIASLKSWQDLDIWNSVRAIGDWTVSASWGYAGKGCDMITRTSTFNVVPEPVSLVLFGLGAGVLGLAQLRRKKK
jgi:hypothetical protein